MPRPEVAIRITDKLGDTLEISTTADGALVLGVIDADQPDEDRESVAFVRVEPEALTDAVASIVRISRAIPKGDD